MFTDLEIDNYYLAGEMRKSSHHFEKCRPYATPLVTISFFAGVDIIVKYIKNICLNFQKKNGVDFDPPQRP